VAQKKRPRLRRKFPDFTARLRAIYGDRVLRLSGAELLAGARDRY
jgi:hypothetical protein